MKTRKIITLALAIITVFTLTFILTGCGNGGGDVAPERTPRPDNGTTQETPAQPDIPETEESSNQGIVSNYNIRELNAQVPNTIAVSNRGIAVIRNDDTVGLASGSGYNQTRDEITTWSNIKAVDFMEDGGHQLHVLFNDGTTALTEALGDARNIGAHARQENLSSGGGDGNIIAVSQNRTGLYSDGTVAGWFRNHLEEINNWTDIIAISVNDGSHYVGLRNDGTVVAHSELRRAGPTRLEIQVNDWTDIISISAGRHQTVGLREDGTVVAVGLLTDRNEEWENSGYKWVGHTNDWRDIISIAAGNTFTLGLRANGEVVIAGHLNRSVESFLDVENWTDVIAIAASPQLIIGLRSDGTILALSSEGLNLDEWDMSVLTNIRTVAN